MHEFLTVQRRDVRMSLDSTGLMAVPDRLIGFRLRLGATVELLDDFSDARGRFRPSRRFWFILASLLSFWTDGSRSH